MHLCTLLCYVEIKLGGDHNKGDGVPVWLKGGDVLNIVATYINKPLHLLTCRYQAGRGLQEGASF
jgi:hypothetical protein